MRRYAALLAFVLVFPIDAFAQTRTFVASTGLDTNPCSLTQPCRSFNAAISAVAADGEVVVLDSAGYGAATISKGVSVIAPLGVHAGISVTTGDGFQLNADGVTINLRGLDFSNFGGNRGINAPLLKPGQLNVDHCVFSNFTGSTGAAIGVVGPNLSIAVRDCEFRNNNVGLDSGGNNISVDVERCRFDHNTIAIATGDGFAVIRDTVFFADGTGVSVMSSTSNPMVTIENCMFSRMSTAIDAYTFSQLTSPTVRLSSTTMVDSGTAMNGAHYVSFGNNRFAGNGTDGTFDATIPLK